MKLETAIIAIATLATVSACMASLPRAIDQERKTRVVRNSNYTYQAFIKQNDGSNIHVVRSQ